MLKTVFKYKLFKLTAFGLLLMLTSSCAAQMPTAAKPHHTPDGGFRNLYGHEERHGFLDFLKWRWQRFRQNRPEPESYHFPLAENDPAFLRSNTDKITLTWIGHATVLLQLNGKNILTDPVFSQRASPVQWAGPSRVVPPGLALEDLPPIDMVVIPHDHYDALDKPTILRLYQCKGGVDAVFFVPLGFKNWFADLGIRNVIELDWWEQHTQKGLVFTAVPVQHWGTFILTDEPLDEPPQKLQAALKQRQNPAPDFRVLKHGETIIWE